MDIPRIQEHPPVFQLANTAHINRCFQALKQNPAWPFEYVGFDTETTVFRKENHRVVSMIQIATRELCLLFQVYRITRGDRTKFPRQLANFLDDQKILKVGVNASGDADWLHESYKIRCRGTVDLEMLAQEKGLPKLSLSELTLMYGDPGLVLDKSKNLIRKWNFDAVQLDNRLVQYAAADAFAGYQIYCNMLADRLNPEYKTWAERYPMTREEEEQEIHELILRQFKKGRPIKLFKLLNAIQYGYSRWLKTIPDGETRRQESKNTIQKFISQGLILLAPEEDEDESSTINNQEQNTKSEISAATTPSPSPPSTSQEVSVYDPNSNSLLSLEISVMLPGVPLDTLISFENAIPFFESKGLLSNHRLLLQEIVQFLEKPIRRKVLLQNYQNSETAVLFKDKLETSASASNTTLNKKFLLEVEELVRLKALVAPPNDNKGNIYFNPQWEKELEQIYNGPIKNS
ncbi:10989_t:CDS:2 [Ambispora leptoticha]|uniref:10989_t:CDS:1 n=1 Tax=Ambispora leptoticha TaxID=144679 RepID=A0A9N8VBN1_9GLOM|nr:10989_t:CDS:2 [Ambispora leptoticha]